MKNVSPLLTFLVVIQLLLDNFTAFRTWVYNIAAIVLHLIYSTVFTSPLCFPSAYICLLGNSDLSFSFFFFSVRFFNCFCACVSPLLSPLFSLTDGGWGNLHWLPWHQTALAWQRHVASFQLYFPRSPPLRSICGSASECVCRSRRVIYDDAHDAHYRMDKFAFSTWWPWQVVKKLVP